MKLEFSSFSCPGKPKGNEDDVLVGLQNDGSYLFAIADGMGGNFGGSIASHTVLKTCNELFAENTNVSISDIYELAANKLIELSCEDPTWGGMGTTLTLCIIDNYHVNVGHVGDCRIYHIRGSGLVTRTRDQTELQELLDEQILSKARAKKYHRRHVLLSAITPKNDYTLDVSDFNIMPGDKVVLLTDGAYSVITKKEIISLAISHDDAKVFAEKLKSEIESSGPEDDYSAICITVN